MDSRKRLKMKTMPEISQVRMFVTYAKSSTYVNVQFYRFRKFQYPANSCKSIKTAVWTPIDRRVFNDNENAYIWKRIGVDRVLLRKVINSTLGPEITKPYPISHPDS